MLRLEVRVEIHSLHRRGFSDRAIARELGVHRETVKKYLSQPEETVLQRVRKALPSKLDAYREFIKGWVADDPHVRATMIYDRLCRLGFTGGYDIVKRYVGRLKKERDKRAYMRFETEPGRQGQVDFAEFRVVTSSGSELKLYLFTMILGYSRRLYGELFRRCDLSTFLDGHIHAFQFFGGVPQELLYDRMRNVYRGQREGHKQFNTSLLSCAWHYGFKPDVTPAYAPWVKGKVERPYSFIREGFWRGYSYSTLEQANRDLREWLILKEERVHGTTHEQVRERATREQPFLLPRPDEDLDTSFRFYRKVARDCTVQVEGNRYVVPHHLVGRNVLVRFKNEVVRIFDDTQLVVRYTAPTGKGQLVQDPRFYEALRRDRDMNKRKYAAHPRGKGKARQTISPRVRYELQVELRPAAAYDQLLREVP